MAREDFRKAIAATEANLARQRDAVERTEQLLAGLRKMQQEAEGPPPSTKK